ncbi:sigma factor [Amycolatopsis sp. WGS_07]|uniref:sigma factor n=1 Tax=Amycolatopsis sp. WGS_07 TaxID=3076764 RepID=UPI003872AB58
MTEFERAAAPLRGELLAHSYRLLGSWHEAEDAVQETYLRGWRAWDDFEQRSSVRTWLHRIATNVCLNAARDRGRRARRRRASARPTATGNRTCCRRRRGSSRFPATAPTCGWR